MGSLAALSNFTGVKQRWKGIVSNYKLKWNGRNDLGDLVGLLYSNRLDEMVLELNAALAAVPEGYGNYFRFNVLTGLRPVEAVKAVNMLRTNPEYFNKELGLLEHFRFPREFIRNTKKAFISVVDPETLAIARATPEYFNKELGLLEHFRFPREFIRNTKKAFISVVDPETLAIARATRSLDYQGIRSEFRRRKLPFHMAYCRKIFATFMRRQVDVELVDLLQGRVPTSIFAKHYNRPNQLSELEKVRASLPELRKLL